MSSDPSTVADLRDPFYASTIPQAYAIAATTVLAYVLMIILLITPRTFFTTGAGGAGTFGGSRGGITSNPGTGTTVVAVGSRPWLQKVATLTVVISLTIAMCETTRVLERQYDIGFMDAAAVRDEVVGGKTIRIIRVISDTFLWLAQVQTLVRLFPRHREKVIIKWAGFCLIVLDTLFSILNNFLSNGATHPESFLDAIPALSYLFELALSLLYACCVVYFAFVKRRFAFYHPNAINIGLVAILALSAVLVPIVFFILDISQPDLAGWGDYVRWVGAAAASVVVWEWVERIENLEREAKKDGVLGREIFDGDEMLEVTPSEELSWNLMSRRRHLGSGNGSGGMLGTNVSLTPGQERRVQYGRDGPDGWKKSSSHSSPTGSQPMTGSTAVNALIRTRYNPTPPPAVSTPVSRANTQSTGGSTIYTVHHHPISESTPPIPEDFESGYRSPVRRRSQSVGGSRTPSRAGISRGLADDDLERQSSSTSDFDADEIHTEGEANRPITPTHLEDDNSSPGKRIRWHPMVQHLKLRRDNNLTSGERSTSGTNLSHTGAPSLKNKLSSFVVSQSEKIKELTRDKLESVDDLPTVIIAAKPRTRRNLQQYMEEEDSGSSQVPELLATARTRDIEKGKKPEGAEPDTAVSSAASRHNDSTSPISLGQQDAQSISARHLDSASPVSLGQQTFSQTSQLGS
jgi:PalH/RIM21